MVIKIKKKSPLSNEPKTTLNIASEASGKTILASKQPAKGPAPFIDKISVVMDVPVKTAHKSYQSIMAQTKDYTIFKSAKPVSPFKRAWRIALDCVPKSKKWPMLMVSYDSEMQQVKQFRIEFSPFDLGTKGMDELHVALMMLMDGGWESFALYGRVTMIEITVDLPGIQVDQFDPIPKQSLYRQAWGKDGLLETVVLGKPQGNQTKIYDRGKKRTDKGQKWQGPVTTRVERRLRLQGQKLADLPQIPNPFLSIIVPEWNISAPPDEPKEKVYLWTLFQDSIKARGVTGALNLFPEKKRSTYRAWLIQNPVSWWNPQAIWEQWSDYIDELGICNPKKWN
jgi:hypothetical protein